MGKYVHKAFSKRGLALLVVLTALALGGTAYAWCGYGDEGSYVPPGPKVYVSGTPVPAGDEVIVSGSGLTSFGPYNIMLRGPGLQEPIVLGPHDSEAVPSPNGSLAPIDIAIAWGLAGGTYAIYLQALESPETTISTNIQIGPGSPDPCPPDPTGGPEGGLLRVS